ncbi:MAG: hypothetical protein RSA53_05470 [Odoribacter sp.]
MAKNDNKRMVAHHYYVEKRMDAKDVAALLGVVPKTVGEWVKKYNWKEEREARAIAPGKRTENVEQIISSLASERIALEKQITELETKKSPDINQIKELRLQMYRIDTTVSGWSKARKESDKDAKVPVTTYLQVMDNVFKALYQYDYKLFLQTVDFQDTHVREISNR